MTIQKELDVSECPNIKQSKLRWRTPQQATEYSIEIKRENEILRAEPERHIVESHDIQELREMINNLAMTPVPGQDSTLKERKRYENRLKLEERNKRIQKNLKKSFHME